MHNFYIKVFVKTFIEQDSSKFTGGLDKEETGQHLIRYKFLTKFIVHVFTQIEVFI